MRATSGGGNASGGAGKTKQSGIFLGKVKNNVDPEGLGRLQVWISQLSSANEDDEGGWFTVRYCPPFAGAGNTQDEAQGSDSTKYKQTNQSYGMWMVPPDKNVEVICGFINEQAHQGVWWACLPMDGHTHAIPAIASGSTHDGKVKPLAERNRYNTTDPQKENRPEHIQSDVISGQGLDKDLRRGHSNAGPFRSKDQHPGLAYGILTPGQHQFIMDDGASGKGGQIKLRTRSGNTMIMDNDEGFIYFINATGSAWLQLDQAGNVDVYAAGDFSVNAEGSINLRAGNNVNIEAAVNFQAVATNNIKMEACEVFNATGTTGMKLATGQNMNILADSQFKMTGQRIDLNGPAADRAEIPEENSLVTNTTVGKSIAGRVPEAEPYGGHMARTGGEQPTTPAGVVDDTLGNPEIEPNPRSYEDVPDPDKIPTPEESNAIDCIVDFSQLKLSDAAFKLMKNREAYRGIMYSDFQGYSVGYGTRIDIFGSTNPASKIDDSLKTALMAGPSEAEARLASRQIIDRHVAPAIINTLKKETAATPACITQAQFDALVMAAYGNPGQATKMASQLVASGASASDGKPANADVAKIWANSGYSNSANQRNNEAKFAMTGKSNADNHALSQDQLRTAGCKADESSIRNNKVRNPQDTWKTPLGNGPSTGNKSDAAYGKPTTIQSGQWERSGYLNTGVAPLNCNLTLQQLKDKYGAPHIDGNYPPGAPSKP